MQTKSRRNLIINTTQMAVWVAVFLIPAIITGVTTRSAGQAWTVFTTSTVILLPYFVLYGLNYYYLIPKFLHGGKANLLWYDYHVSSLNPGEAKSAFSKATNVANNAAFYRASADAIAQ